MKIRCLFSYNKNNFDAISILRRLIQYYKLLVVIDQKKSNNTLPKIIDYEMTEVTF